MQNLLSKRLIIICGHYGTGKTNISVNLAEFSASCQRKTAIVDLDIVNPYFRTADNAAELNALGIKTLIPEFANTNVDIPSLPPALPLIFESDEITIIDVGGDENGAVVLGGFAERFLECGYNMFYIFNFYRPENHSAESAAQSLKAIEQVSRLKFTGIINNSNLGAETTNELVKNSIMHAEEFSSLVSLPIMLTTALSNITLDCAYKIKDVTKKYF